MVDNVFWIHGLPVDVVSDGGPHFVAWFWKEFCKQNGASMALSSGFYPKINGQSERSNQDLERALHCLVYIVQAPGVNNYHGLNIPTVTVVAALT